MQKLLTIVVPVYKVEPYINKCLDSCLIYKMNEQGEKVLDEELMNQLEVIIVNDGTPDQSAEMSREFVNRYPNTFRQIDKENGGHGSAWNVGLKEAMGKYLRFLDSDDWLVNLDAFMKDLDASDTDLVFTQLDKFLFEENEYIRYPILEEPNVVKTVDDFPYLQMNDYTVCNFQYCTYKTELLQPMLPLFDEHVFYDDMILHILPIVLGKTYVVFGYPLYQYLVGRQGQTMSPEVMERNLAFNQKEYDKCYRFFLSNKVKMSESAVQWASYVLATHIGQHFLPRLPKMPYLESKQMAKKIKDEFSQMGHVPRMSKQMKRLLKYPYWVDYIVEKIRMIKNRN